MTQPRRRFIPFHAGLAWLPPRLSPSRCVGAVGWLARCRVPWTALLSACPRRPCPDRHELVLPPLSGPATLCRHGPRSQLKGRRDVSGESLPSAASAPCWYDCRRFVQRMASPSTRFAAMHGSRPGKTGRTVSPRMGLASHPCHCTHTWECFSPIVSRHAWVSPHLSLAATPSVSSATLCSLFCPRSALRFTMCRLARWPCAGSWTLGRRPPVRASAFGCACRLLPRPFLRIGAPSASCRRRLCPPRPLAPRFARPSSAARPPPRPGPLLLRLAHPAVVASLPRPLAPAPALRLLRPVAF
jgi:hypothetical protein